MALLLKVARGASHHYAMWYTQIGIKALYCLLFQRAPGRFLY